MFVFFHLALTIRRFKYLQCSWLMMPPDMSVMVFKYWHVKFGALLLDMFDLCLHDKDDLWQTDMIYLLNCDHDKRMILNIYQWGIWKIWHLLLGLLAKLSLGPTSIKLLKVYKLFLVLQTLHERARSRALMPLRHFSVQTFKSLILRFAASVKCV